MQLYIRLKSLAHNTDGALSTLWALMLPVLIGSVGLAVDTGVWYSDMRKQQAVADATALTVARAINGTATQSGLQTIAQTEAARNGYTHDTDNVSVTVEFPPNSGSYSGDSNAARVIISRPQNRIFSVLALGSDPVASTRATGLKQETGNACILALDSVAVGALDLTGNITINMSGCTLASNSTNTRAIEIGGNATITADQLYSAGGIRKTGNYTVNTSESDVTNGNTISDPYSDYSTPSFSGCDQNNYTTSSSFGTINLNPGVYCNGMTFGGTGTVNLAPGTYIVDRGSFNMNGNVTVNGTGVTIILTSSTGSNHATANINATSTVNLSAPTSGSNAGMLFYRDRDASAASMTFNGNASTNLQGVIYFPKDSLNLSGNFSSTATCTQIVSSKVDISGNLSFTNSCSATGVEAINLSSSIRLAE